MPAGIRIEREEPDVAVVLLAGEQESYQSARLAPELESLLHDGSSVVVDLSHATFVDSTTIAVLLNAQREAQRRGIGFVLEMDPPTAVYARRIFEITGLGSLFSILPTRDEALAAARAGRAGARPETEPA
jgi:anti-anti-sigma factor